MTDTRKSDGKKNRADSSRRKQDELVCLQQLVENLNELHRWQSRLIKEMGCRLESFISAKKKR